MVAKEQEKIYTLRFLSYDNNNNNNFNLEQQQYRSLRLNYTWVESIIQLGLKQ